MLPKENKYGGRGKVFAGKQSYFTRFKCVLRFLQSYNNNETLDKVTFCDLMTRVDRVFVLEVKYKLPRPS